MPTQQDIQQQQSLLQTYRKTLAMLLNQKAMHGSAFVPPSILHGIAEARGHIAMCKQFLRAWGIDVEDLPGDDETPTLPVKAVVARPKKEPLPPTRADIGALRLYLTSNGTDWTADVENTSDREFTQINLRLRPPTGVFANPITAMLPRLSAGERGQIATVSLRGGAGRTALLQISISYWPRGQAQPEKADGTIDVYL